MAKRPHTEPQPHVPPAQHGFAKNVAVSKVGESGYVLDVTANDAERAKIAEYLGIADVAALKSKVSLTHWRGKGIAVKGQLHAEVTQTCVVSLEPIKVTIDAEFDRRFLPADRLEHDETHRDVQVDPEGEDPPEPLGREIDVGEILVEELSLNLDPYPRKEGVELPGEAAPEAEKPASPFAVLAKLKPKPGR